MSGSVTTQQVLAHICQILELDSQAVAFLEAHRIKSVRKLTTSTVDSYEELASLDGSPLNKIDIDQLNLFKTWYTNFIQKNGQVSNEDIINELTKSS